MGTNTCVPAQLSEFNALGYFGGSQDLSLMPMVDIAD